MEAQTKKLTLLITSIVTLAVFLFLPITSASFTMGMELKVIDLITNLGSLFESLEYMGDMAGIAILVVVLMLLPLVGAIIALVGAITQNSNQVKNGSRTGIGGLIALYAALVVSAFILGSEMASAYGASIGIGEIFQLLVEALKAFGLAYWLSLAGFIVMLVVSGKPVNTNQNTYTNV